MLKSALHWRRQHHVDKVLENWNPPGALLEYYPGGWHHYDKGMNRINLYSSNVSLVRSDSLFE
jgi:hypothetical protein